MNLKEEKKMIKKLITFDWALKKLLRSKANFDILEGFLSELLFEDIKIQEIIESESNRHTEDDKQNRVDMLVRNSSDELIIIEVQQSVEHDYFQRMLFGTCKAVTDFMFAGSRYSEVKKVISVNIVTFDLGQGEDYIYKGSTNFTGMNKHDNLKLSLTQKQHYNRDDISDIYPEYYLLKVNQFNDYAKTNLDQWVYFLKNSEIKDDFTAKGLTKAKEVFKVMNMSDDERKDYEKHLDFLSYMSSLEETRVIDMEEAEKKGIEQGEYKKALEIAKAMKIEKISDLIISRATGLTVEEIEKLK
jgi:predicted transposase/invertase (TIGR01784 family)